MEVERGYFERLVGDALDSIPEVLGQRMQNIVVVVEDWPTPEQLRGVRGTLLGLYQGVNLTRRSPLSYSFALPDKISIFMGPIAERCNTVEELAALVHRTVLHEVAHHFGISDARLHEIDRY